MHGVPVCICLLRAEVDVGCLLLLLSALDFETVSMNLELTDDLACKPWGSPCYAFTPPPALLVQIHMGARDSNSCLCSR